MAAFIVMALIGAPAVSFARARGGSGGGYSSGSWNSGVPGGIGSRGSRTYDQNGAKPIQQSTTPKPPATAPQPAPTARPAPARQPSFLQRPLLAGLAVGVAGSWIGSMLFGATDSSAQTNDAGEPASVPDTTAENSDSAWILLLLLLLGAGMIFYFLKVQRPSLPDFSGITGRDPSSDNLPTRRSATTRQKISADSITSADKTAFQQLLIDIQAAWSKQDLTELRRFVTPEMLNYFSAALADNRSQDIENHVDDVVLLRAEILEAWTEQATHYVTAGLRWSARDYNLSLTKQRGEPDYVVEGSEETPTESGEAWTFMRSQDGKWMLSAIQQ
jgi:predicted lipid-binding transport protein (Tim44 family)